MTYSFIPDRKTILAIGLGVVTILLRDRIISLFSALFFLLVAKITPVSQISSAIVNFPEVTANHMFQVVSSIITIFAGGIVGYLSKNKGWLYGALTGLFASAISLSFFPLLLIETLIGGWLGEKLANSQK